MQKADILQLGPKSWDKFKGFVTSRLDKKYRTVVVDTTGPLYNLCMEYVCDKENWSHPQDASHGKGWNAVRREFQSAIASLADACQSIGATLIFIDHTKEEEIVTTTTKTTKVNCAMPGQARSVIMPVPDHVWYLGYAEPDDKTVDPLDALKSKGSKRCLFVTGSINIEAGTRDPKVKRHTIFPLSKSKPFEQIEKELYT